jgi:cell shape-determining protein MreC
MKTNFLPRSRRRGKRGELLLAALVLVLAAAFFSLFGSRLTGLFAPLWRSNFAIDLGIRNFFGSLRGKDALMNENNALKSELDAQNELIVSLRSIASSRDDLLASFGRVPAGAVPAGVLVHPPETPYDVLLIDAGDDLGVKQASLVYTSSGMLIGAVSQVFSKTSEVKLYSSAGERTDAVLERGNVPVTLVGRGGGNMEFTLPRDTSVEVGDRILSPRLEAPLMGVVGRVEVTPTDSVMSVLVASPYNPVRFLFVSVVHE